MAGNAARSRMFILLAICVLLIVTISIFTSTLFSASKTLTITVTVTKTQSVPSTVTKTETRTKIVSSTVTSISTYVALREITKTIYTTTIMPVTTTVSYSVSSDIARKLEELSQRIKVVNNTVKSINATIWERFKEFSESLQQRISFVEQQLALVNESVRESVQQILQQIKELSFNLGSEIMRVAIGAPDIVVIGIDLDNDTLHTADIIYVKDGKTGRILLKSSDAVEAIQYAINISRTGQTIWLVGNFDLRSRSILVYNPRAYGIKICGGRLYHGTIIVDMPHAVLCYLIITPFSKDIDAVVVKEYDVKIIGVHINYARNGIVTEFHSTVVAFTSIDKVYDAGIRVRKSAFQIRVIGSFIEQNGYGVYVEWAGPVVLLGNIIQGNKYAEVYIEDSVGAVIIGNWFETYRKGNWTAIVIGAKPGIWVPAIIAGNVIYNNIVNEGTAIHFVNGGGIVIGNFFTGYNTLVRTDSYFGHVIVVGNSYATLSSKPFVGFDKNLLVLDRDIGLASRKRASTYWRGCTEVVGDGHTKEFIIVRDLEEFMLSKNVVAFVTAHDYPALALVKDADNNGKVDLVAYFLETPKSGEHVRVCVFVLVTG